MTNDSFNVSSERHRDTQSLKLRANSLHLKYSMGAIQVLRNAVGGGKVSDFLEKKRYEDVRFNTISVTRGWVGVKF